ncbi:hypothetical protein HK102_005473 [Quaeritorhiza haematococci]|nr:hypothetical protein HK102_005473 [Quaeritorhiza haematococci]
MNAVIVVFLSFLFYVRPAVAQNETVIKIGWATSDLINPTDFLLAQRATLPELFVDYWANEPGLFPQGVTLKLITSPPHGRDRVCH